MKKLLLAASILALSATAMAVGNTATDTLTVSANYITPITVTLDTDTIDFKDVYVGSASNEQTVVASLTGETGENFSYAVTTEDSGIKFTGATGTGIIKDGAATFDFGIDMDRSQNRADIVDQLVTVTVNYTSIDDDTVVETPAA